MVASMANVRNDDLFPEARNPQGTCVINERCLVRTQDGFRIVSVSGIVLAQYALTDRMAEAHAMVSLVYQGWADQIDVARSFGCSVRTVRRHQRRFEENGLAGLARDRGYPRGRARLATSRRHLVQQLKIKGYAQREIARRIGVSENAVRKRLRRLGWKATSPIQTEMSFSDPGAAHPKLSGSVSAAAPSPLPASTQSANPNLSALSSVAKECPSATQDTDPADRRGDRLLAYLGLLDDAAPLFGSGRSVPRLEFCWPCQPWCKAASSSVPIKFTAASAPLSIVCAPVC